MIFPRLLALAAIVSLTGCATSPEATREEAAVAGRADLPTNLGDWSSVAAQVGDVKPGWLAAFNDPTLTALVEEALMNNRSLQGTSANVDRARALAEQAGAALSPNLNLTAGGGGGGTINGAASGNLNVGLQTSWELDLWGRVRAGRNAAAEQFFAAEADYRFAQEALAANVTRAYFIYVEGLLQEGVAARSVEMLEETNRIVGVQFDNGVASQQDVSLARSDLASARDRLVTAQGASRDAARSLELLLGRYPGAEFTADAELPNVPLNPPAGLPSDLLERRPDLIAAERRLAAAFNATDQAEAARLPQISLTASIGGSSNQLSNLLNPGNIAWQAASNLLAPLFDGGLRQAQVDAANADQRAAISAYAQTALNAFGETEKALDDSALLTQRRTLLEEAAASAAEAYRVAELNYEQGEIDLITLLGIESRVLNARSSLLTILRNQLTVYVDLNLALGGTWQT